MKPTPIIVASGNGAKALPVGVRILKRGGSALDAVEACARYVEADVSDTSVGRGGLPNILGQVEPDDLLHFGLIPELIGRLPVVSVLHPMSRDGLLNILTQPRNAIVKQYKKLFEMEGVSLEFDHDALAAVVDRAMKHGTGARALRSIVEKVMLDIMYHLPANPNIVRCFIHRETIDTGAEPIYTLKEQKKTA